MIGTVQLLPTVQGGVTPSGRVATPVRKFVYDALGVVSLESVHAPLKETLHASDNFALTLKFGTKRE